MSSDDLGLYFGLYYPVTVKHWHPGHPNWRGKGRDVNYPPGWWIWPALFISLFFWAGLYLIVDWAISG